MTSLASVQLAIDLATSERDQVVQEVAQARRVLQSCQDQFNQLSSYAQETQERWVTSSRGVATPAVMHHYYQFMDKCKRQRKCECCNNAEWGTFSYHK